MPGWVLPAVAAELWGVPIEQVMADVAAGRVNSRVEGEFIFVDVQPAADDEAATAANTACADDADDAFQADAPALAPSPYRRSLAWSIPSDVTSSIMSDPIVTAAERDALMNEAASLAEDFGDTWAAAADANADAVDLDAIADADADEADSGDESDVDAPDVPVELTADDIPNWNEVRSRVSRTRRPPRRILDAA